MDSDDDFLIEDDEDFDSGAKDELFDIVKQEKASSGISSGSVAYSSPAKASLGSQGSISTSNNGNEGGIFAQGSSEVVLQNVAVGANNHTSPSLVVAPKPLHTPSTQVESRSPQSQAANGSPTYANFSIFCLCASATGVPSTNNLKLILCLF